MSLKTTDSRLPKLWPGYRPGQIRQRTEPNLQIVKAKNSYGLVLKQTELETTIRWDDGEKETFYTSYLSGMGYELLPFFPDSKRSCTINPQPCLKQVQHSQLCGLVYGWLFWEYEKVTGHSIPRDVVELSHAKLEPVLTAFVEIKVKEREQHYEVFDQSELRAVWEREKATLVKALLSTRAKRQHLPKIGSQFFRDSKVGTIIGYDLDTQSFICELAGERFELPLEVADETLDLILPLVELKENYFLQTVTYQHSKSGAYFKAWIGFSSKKAASRWLSPVKNRIGRLSKLRENVHSNGTAHTGLRHEYEVETFKHKRVATRVRKLEQIAQLPMSNTDLSYKQIMRLYNTR